VERAVWNQAKDWGFLSSKYISIYRQGEILARKENKCYPEWVVFFIYTNMALGTPSSTPEIQKDITPSGEAQERVNTVANAAIAVLNKDLDTQKAVKNLFGKMVTKNLRDPESVWKIQDGLYGARDARLTKADPSERLAILQSFSGFMEKWTEWLAQMNRDVGLSNELKWLKTTSDTKVAQVQATYKNIITNNHPNLTA
jgi:hypothetical protein